MEPSETFTCPACGAFIRDRAAVAAGYCADCKDHTGLCTAGRALACTNVLNAHGWHDGCILGGEIPVEFLRDGRVLVPAKDDPLETGDELLFVTSEDVEDELATLLSGSSHHHGAV